MSGELVQNRSLGSSCLVRPGSHDAKNMKDSCCVLLQAIRCYRLPLDECRLREKERIKPNLALNKERSVCVCVCLFVLQVCVNAACVRAEKFHSRCIILSVGSFSLLLSHLVWDECVCASLSECLCVFMCSSSPPWPRILHSAQLRMHAQAPHCAPFL